MEVEKLNNFLENCCRVCLAIENEMVDSTNIVENFNKSIDQLLFECADMKMLSENSYPKLVCEECTGELVMVAKFREKCAMSMAALNQLTKRNNKKSTTIIKLVNPSNESNDDKTDTNSAATAVTELDVQGKSETFIEPIEYDDDENVEYVIFDSSQDFEENDNAGDYIEKTIAKSPADGNISRENSAKRKQIHTTKIEPSKSIIQHHCKHCGAGFAQLKNLTRHLQTHSDVEINELNRFACATCEEIFTDEQDWMEHQKKHEKSDDANSEQQPTDSSTLPTETKSKKRSLNKGHMCSYCGRGFPSVSLLTTHIRIHTGERPYHCSHEKCTKTFKTQGALDLHSRRHEGIKPYRCTVCNRGFVESSNLKVHMRTHTGEKPHKCLQCGRSFSRVFLLQIHQRTHTGEKPFSCTVCTKSFAQQGDLAAHKRIHSGERPHQCKICHKGFIKSSGLTQHMRRHNKKSETVMVDVASTNEDSGQIEFINIVKPNDNQTKNEQVLICYKEYNENEAYTEYF